MPVKFSELAMEDTFTKIRMLLAGKNYAIQI